MMKQWFKSGTPWIWMNAGAISIALIAVAGLLGLITVRGMSHFWPAEVYHLDVQGNTIIAEFVETEVIPASRLPDYKTDEEFIVRHLIKSGNRDLHGADFGWVIDEKIDQRTLPEDVMVLERMEWGNFYGYLQSLHESEKEIVELSSNKDDLWNEFQLRINRVVELRTKIRELEVNEIGAINYQLERLRLKQRKLEMQGKDTEDALASIQAERVALDEEYKHLEKELTALYLAIARDAITAKVMDGSVVTIPLNKIIKAWQPNSLSVIDKIVFYFDALWEFITADPREANTEGGVFPAIFGTVMMVLLMAVMVTPFGVIAAIYLREYATQGIVTRTIRIAVNNLAGVPSIVYGIFGLGFFIYFLGGSIDQLFYAEALPAPTFGTPGLLWSSLTLAILTLPVVIVTTEEGLARIPRSLREGSIALGATKAETLWRVILPMASPAIMTGLILAVARAAGEVAPLMLVGVVKLAPTLPVDGNFPFMHLDRKFMHLGFHIYDVGFQSPNVEAARPLVYATAFLLVLVIVVLNISAISLRNRLREKYRSLDN
jgi:phosphate transport system permease protein